MEGIQILCAEKHKAIDNTLERHEGLINDQGERLNKLEIVSVRTETIVQELCEQIKSLVSTMEKQQVEQRASQEKQTNKLLAIAGTAILLLAGFVIWYIQSL